MWPERRQDSNNNNNNNKAIKQFVWRKQNIIMIVSHLGRFQMEWTSLTYGYQFEQMHQLDKYMTTITRLIMID